MCFNSGCCQPKICFALPVAPVFCNQNEDLPTVDEVRDCWNLGPEVKKPKKVAQNADQSKKDKCKTTLGKHNACGCKKAVLLWWVDCFLAMVVGIDAWGPTVRLYFLPTSN